MAEGVGGWGGQRRSAPSTTPAGRQRSERPNIMLMAAFDWFLHDFTPHRSPQLSDGVTGAEREERNSKKAGGKKILIQTY